jgi:hypothetical protein
MERWPDVPALYGWLALDRRGRWLIRGETITRPQIIDTLNANYEADARGCWYFQNGPQRGYVELARAPLLLRAQPDGRLETHTGRSVETPRAAWLDEDGGLWLATEHGPAALADEDLGWVLERLSAAGLPLDESALGEALALPSGAVMPLVLAFGALQLPLRRFDAREAPERLGFRCVPAP